MSTTATPHILIVESEALTRSTLRRLLEEHGYRVSDTRSVNEARQLELDQFDLVLVDLNMPDAPGTTLIEVCRPTPVLLTAANRNTRSAVAAIKAGAADYLTKPFERDELLAVIQSNLDTPPYSENTERDSAKPTPIQINEPRTKLIGECPPMQRLYDRILRVAPTQSTVLILGESGTGKELVAKSIHEHSDRRAAPLISINCAAIPETLIESELFGHEKGSFTGAHAARKGLVEAADKGTLFLDEIGELPLEAQARLLRLLQEKEIRRIGSVTSKRVDVRLIAATHRNLKQLAKKGEFREDLYYRLHVIDLKIPPLRDRAEDLETLAQFFLDKASKKHGIEGKRLLPKTMNLIRRYEWPGNIRELENAMERAVILSDSKVITPDILDLDIPRHFEQIIQESHDDEIKTNQKNTRASSEKGSETIADPAEDLTLEDYFQRFVLEHQDQMTETELAQKLGVSRKCLWERRQKFGIPRKKK